MYTTINISIHVPLAGNVRVCSRRRAAVVYFYPRSPCGERLIALILALAHIAISIHVPLAGNVNRSRSSVYALAGHFYPRSPCGERLLHKMLRYSHRKHFYPRSPCGERHSRAAAKNPITSISIHVPLAGNVLLAALAVLLRNYFYPRSPCGERPEIDIEKDIDIEISIHVPLAGNVRIGGVLQMIHKISIHVPLAGNVSALLLCCSLSSAFLSTFPLRGTSANCDRLLPLVCKSIGNSKHSVLAAWLTRGVITPDLLSGMGAKISGGF